MGRTTPAGGGIPSTVGRRRAIVATLAAVAGLAAGCTDHPPANHASQYASSSGVERPSGRQAVAVPWYQEIDPTVDPKFARMRELGEPEPALPDDPSKELAHEYLLKTGTFAGSAVGYAATPSNQVRAFRVILKAPEATGAFMDLVRRGSLPGQLYGLCGLYLVDRPAFERLSRSYADDQRRVPTFFACIGGPAAVDKILKGIADGRYPNDFKMENMLPAPLLAP